MKRILIISFLFLFRFSFAQQKSSVLDEMISVSSQCVNLQKKAKTEFRRGNIDKSIEFINSAIDSLSAHHIGGLLPCIMARDLVYYKSQKKDWNSAITNVMAFRNRALNLVLREINDSFAYGLFDAMDDSYFGEGLPSVQLYHNAIVNIVRKMPYVTTNQLAFESLLHTKSLQQKADNNFHFLAYETGDERAKGLLRQLELTRDSLKQWQDEQARLSFRERNKTWDPEIIGWKEEKHYQAQIRQIKSDLVECYQAHPIFSQKFFCSWRDVQAKLETDEIAIEFVRIPDWENDSIHYAALCIKQDSEYPSLVSLFEENQLSGLDAIHNSTELYNLIWKPLEEQLRGIRNVYFSLDGNLHTFAVEALKDGDGAIMADRFGMFRLSSTRELLKPSVQKGMEDGVLYGGLKYTASEETLLSIKGQTKKRGSLDDISEETLLEVNEIGEALKARNIKHKIFEGLDGTEESFKALSGSKTNLIHLSTHGFYEPSRIILKETNVSPEDSIMSASGLLMSGARLAWEGKAVPEGMDDGILTSEEISQLYFPSLDLVVLSACETGLGNISGTEGVFGLQRGFKKAGARSILMTLWEVDDVATRLFMVEFYKHYLSGESKTAAMKAAQQYLRDYIDEEGKKCYESPEHWAAFVLLDAI